MPSLPTRMPRKRKTDNAGMPNRLAPLLSRTLTMSSVGTAMSAIVNGDTGGGSGRLYRSERARRFQRFFRTFGRQWSTFRRALVARRYIGLEGDAEGPRQAGRAAPADRSRDCDDIRGNARGT